MGRTLKLASPLMRGTDVRVVQKLLKGKNPWKKDFRPGRVDGKFGPYSAAAVKRAKFFLGYPTRQVNGHAGESFVGFLSGEPTPRLFKARAKKRRAAVRKRLSLRAKALDSAVKKLGMTENPAGSNQNALTRWWYGDNTGAPWCAISVSHSYIEAGSKAFSKGRDFAYVPYIEHAAKLGRGLMRVNPGEAKPGDVVTFEFSGDHTSDHVGLFVKWKDRRAGSFVAVEGNTAVGNDANGGKQMLRDRTMNQVAQVIRVLG